MNWKIFPRLYGLFLYAAQLPFVVMIVMAAAWEDMPEWLTNTLCAVCLAFALLAAATIVANIVVAVKYNFLKDVCPYAVTFRLKLALVPFFVINFVLWLIIYLATLHPVLIFVMIVLMAMSIIGTYIFMVGGGVCNMAYLIRRMVKGFKVRYVIFLLMHFIYVLDVVAAIILYYCDSRERMAEEVQPSQSSEEN